MVSFVKTNREVAKLLGIKLLRQRNRLKGQLSEINGWRALPEFPAYQKGKGYSAVEVLQWAERFASQIAPEKQRREAVSQILGGDKPTAKAIKVLGNIQHPTPGGAQSNAQHSSAGCGQDAHSTLGNGVDPTRPVRSIRHLAELLSRYFNRHIMEQRVQKWLNGDLPAGAPPFPPRDPNRNGWTNAAPCFEWVKNFYVAPMSAGGGITQDELFAEAKIKSEMAELLTVQHIERERKAVADAKERENNAKWILRAVALGEATRAFNDFQHLVEQEYERGAPVRRREKLAAQVEELKGLGVKELVGQGIEAGNASALLNSLTLELLNSFNAWDAQEERARIDRIRMACAAKGNLTQSREEAKAL